jgi:glutamyl-tRNA reductase
MSIVVIGVNHKTAPLAVLERLALGPDDVAKSIDVLAQRDTIREAAVLATCGRTELYLVAERFHGAYADATDFLAGLAGMRHDELHAYLFSQHEDAAATHLFDVAAGLDSAVLGESEILGQVRAAWQVALDCGGAKSTLDLLFRHALRTGKRARSETAIGAGTASISHAAVELVTDRIGPLAGRRVLVIGAGDMGGAVTAALRKAGAGDITVANRTRRRGESLADGVGGAVVDFDLLADALAGSDVAVTCAATAEPVITPALLDGTGRRPLLLVDIGLPRNVDRRVTEVSNVTLLDLDDVSAWAAQAWSARAAEAERVREIVAEELDQFLVDLTARQAAPLVARLHDRAEEIRSAELRRFAGRLSELDTGEQESVEALTRAIVAKLLHAPSVHLRHDAGTPQGERNAAAVSDLFDLQANRGAATDPPM